MRRAASSIAFASTLVVLGVSFLAGGCGEKAKYKPEPAYSGPKAALPKVPELPKPSTFKDGNAWTVHGIQHHLSSFKHRAEVEMKAATITGYVVDVYRPKEPAGKEGCVYPLKKSPPTSKDPTPKGVQCDTALKGIEPPHFWIADSKDEKDRSKMIEVMGYASSYIQLFMARDWYKEPGHKIDSTKEDDLYLDNNYTARITYLGEPTIGSKVEISGLFGTKYEEGQGGRRTVPSGIIDVTSNKKGKIVYKEGKEEPLELK